MKNILIWDSQMLCPEGDYQVVLWSQFNSSNPDKIISIPELIEENASSLRAQYLEWIYDLGLAKVDDSNVIDALRIDENLSYWWMTPMAEKFNISKSPHITDAIRFIAFAEFHRRFRAASILLVTNNQSLIKSFELYCKRANLKFDWELSQDRVIKVRIIRSIVKALPDGLKVFIWLTKYVFKRLPFRSVSARAWCKSKAQLTFFSYFTNLSQKSYSGEDFESQYWGHLPEVFMTKNKHTNWLHIFVEDSLGLNHRSANKLIKQFNLNNMQDHILLDSFLNLRLLFRSLIQWSNLRRRFSKIENSLASVLSKNVNIWPFFQGEYKKKTKGINLLENILMLNLLQSALSYLPKQNLGIYLFEQQPWEVALISLWKAHKHNTLIGMQHSTVLFWDLRYFHDPRTYMSKTNLSFPTPDKIAVNGPVAKQTLINSGYPEIELELTEALRYLYLEKLGHNEKSVIKKETMKLLVLGDYEIKKTLIQLNLLESSLKLLTFSPRVVIKPHPLCPINSYKKFEITKKSLSELLLEADMVFTSLATSSAVDAYCAGLPVISIIDPLTLNLSPLRGIPGVQFVNTPPQLSEAINSLCENYQPTTDRVEYFTLGSNLQKWNTLLNL